MGLKKVVQIGPRVMRAGVTIAPLFDGGKISFVLCLHYFERLTKRKEHAVARTLGRM